MKKTILALALAGVLGGCSLDGDDGAIGQQGPQGRGRGERHVLAPLAPHPRVKAGGVGAGSFKAIGDVPPGKSGRR